MSTTPEDTLSKTIHTPKGSPIVLDLTRKRISLTDLWKAIGSPENKRPVDWLRTESAQSLATYLADEMKVGVAHLYTTNPGGGGGTWANWHLGLAYAKYLSPRFHVWCNEVIRSVMSDNPAPPPAPPPPPSSGDMVSFATKIQAAALVQEHLLRIQTRDPRLVVPCLNAMSEVWELIWKMKLPILEEGAPPPVENVENEDAEPPPASSSAQPPVEVLADPLEGEVLKAVPVAPGEVPVALQAEEPGWGTGNAVASWIDDRFGRLMTTYINKTINPARPSPNRKAMGGKFNDLMRQVHVHPRVSKGYTPPSRRFWEPYAKLVTRPYQVTLTGETKTIEEVRFNEKAMNLAIDQILGRIGMTRDSYKEAAIANGIPFKGV